MRHESVELMPALVPLDAVEVVAVQVVTTDQVSALPRLNVPRDTEVNLGQTLQLYNGVTSLVIYIYIRYSRLGRSELVFDPIFLKGNQAGLMNKVIWEIEMR